MANPGLTANLQAGFCVAAPLSKQFLRKSLDILTARHESLRTTFVMEEVAIRRVHEHGEVPIVTLDLRELDSGTEACMQAIVKACEQPTHSPTSFWKLIVGETRDSKSLVILSGAHLVCDAASTGIAVRELWSVYAALNAGETPQLQDKEYDYSDFVGTQVAWQKTEDFDRQASMAARILERDLAEHEKIGCAPEGSGRTRPAVMVRHILPASVLDNFKRFAAQHSTSLSVAAFSATVLTLAKTYSSAGFFTAYGFANRMAKGSQDIVGYLSNNLPIFMRANPEARWSDLGQAAHLKTMNVLRFGSVPFSAVSQRVLGETRPPNTGNVLSRFMFNRTPDGNDLSGPKGQTATLITVNRNGAMANDAAILFRVMNERLMCTVRVPHEENAKAEHFMEHLMQIVTA